VTATGPPELVTCPGCGASVLRRTFCSVCGEPLESGGSPETRRAQGYAADPRESARAIRLATTIFPRLPSADQDAFRLALVVGVVVVVAIAAAGYLAVALVASALLVPLLLAVYLYSADVYEDEPIRVILVTLAWGAVAGVLYGVLLRELFPARIGPSGEELLETIARVVILPALAVVLMVAGPLALLRYRKFNDVLDGATFGAVSGATFVGAQVLAQSVDMLTAGLQPGGDTWAWVLRILEHGVALPLIAAGAAAGVCGAVWLRYRSPVRDRARLRWLGVPVLALVLACLLLVGANAALILLRDLPRLLALVALAVIAIAWLRQLIDVGLRQEAVEAATSEPQVCQECGRETPAGSFCVECGVALRALPKRAAQAGPREDEVGPAATSPRHGQPSRLSGARSFVAFLVGWAFVLGVAAVLVIVLAPVTTPPCADPTLPCPATIGPAPLAAVRSSDQASGTVMRFGQTHATDGSPWQVDFDPRYWTLDTSDQAGAVWLTTGYTAATVRGNTAEIPVSLRLEVVPAGDATVDAMMERLAASVRDTLESTVVRDDHGSRLLRPHIGFQPAAARYVVGDFGELGALMPFGAHALAASDGRLTAGIILYVGQPDESFPFFSGSVRTTRFVGDLLDDILKRFYWTEAGP
jgi:hypothetical protein